MKPLFVDSDWTMETIEKTWAVIDKIAKEKYGLDYYRPDIRLITSEQMLDAYSSVGMPIMYNHWSFGKSFIANEQNYKKGRQGLAYEIVINTDPSIAYLMESNTMTMQALVMAHAICGHASFFKGNYLFTEFTKADFILDYLSYAKDYVAKMEERLGSDRVEEILDACHALQYHGIDKYRKPKHETQEQRLERKQTWEDYRRTRKDDVMDTTLESKLSKKVKRMSTKVKQFLDELTPKYKVELPTDNLLYFIEKMSPVLSEEEKELVRIVRTVAQYFYPQMQTQVMNEGWATFWHHQLMADLHEEGYITDGSYLEFLHNHTNVVSQPDYDSPYFSGINPYALGFAMFTDLKRICTSPTEEDYKWFPDIVNTNWVETLHEIMRNYRDESFVLQYLSPRVIREFKLFCLYDDSSHPRYEISAIHDDDDYRVIRKKLSEQYMLSRRLPDIQIVDYHYDTDRSLHLLYTPGEDESPIHEKSALQVIKLMNVLWGFDTWVHPGKYDPNVI